MAKQPMRIMEHIVRRVGGMSRNAGTVVLQQERGGSRARTIPFRRPSNGLSRCGATGSGAACDPLGPTPRQSVEVFSELGLSEEEIARYFGVDRRRVSHLMEAERH